MTTRDKILLENKAWILEKLALDKDYFSRLSAMHEPKILWIGSSDSLVPVREITNTEPGEILVYRNMGNLVKETDLSLMAVIEDAIEVSHIEYIIVCGYSHCSSLNEVLTGTEKPLTREWLLDLRAIMTLHQKELDPLPYEQKERRLAELNIAQQVKNLSNLQLVKKAWANQKPITLLGWYFDLNTGTFHEIASVSPPVQQ
ncbi:MAG: carbonic anhydrase [Cyclobacteriaceae bacterium]